MKTIVITTARGRHQHLRQQLRGLGRCTKKPDAHLVVAMDDPAIASCIGGTDCDATAIVFDTDSREVPVAAARNAGAETAIAQGADMLIFLDVDCIPDRDMIAGYCHAAANERHSDALLCGPVSYLPPPPAGGYDLETLSGLAPPHPARPAPPFGKVLDSTDYQLFWSLSFAVTASTWQRIGGFHTGYVGYGAEDTDFAQLAAAVSVPLCWVGGARAFHQYHSVADPPAEHLDEIVANARLFYQRWGWWPMSGWLRAFADARLVRWDATTLEALDANDCVTSARSARAAGDQT